MVNIRMDADLHDSAVRVAAPYELSVIVRALLRGHVRGDFKPRQADIDEEMIRSPRVRPRPKRRR